MYTRETEPLAGVSACWRQANVTLIPKGPPPSSVANYWPISITSVLSQVFERQVSARIGWFMELMGVLPTTSLLIGRVWVPVMHFCVCCIHWKVHWREGRRLESYRLILAQLLIGPTIREFCIRSVLWVLDVLCCLYWHSFYQIDHSMLWWRVVEVNWLPLCQECRRVVLWARYCSSNTHRSFFPFWRIKADRLCRWLHFDSCCAIPRY